MDSVCFKYKFYVFLCSKVSNLHQVYVLYMCINSTIIIYKFLVGLEFSRFSNVIDMLLRPT